ncbi:hypothetical protein [Aliikangiella maris]|uniref:Uncharacterized protein n=2 Tax=Aliikangiella maris TaxID=3162458 RepID=A0ABV3MKG7_9GAMM
MSDSVISWLLVAEIALPFAVLSIVLIFIIIRGRKSAKEAARNLILKIKNNEEGEKEATYNFLTQKLSIEESEAKKLAKKIINERKFLFRNLISGFLDKNTDAIASLEADMSRIVARYHSLDIQPQASETIVEDNPENLEKIQELQKEVKTLKHEVHVTLTTLNNIFAEFSSMFGEEVPDTEMSVDQIITAMESFSDKSVAGRDDDEPADESDDLMMGMSDEDDELDAFAEEIEEVSSEDVELADHDEAELSADELAEPAPEKEELDFSIDDELDDIDSALDELELGDAGGASQLSNDEPSWDEAFEESGDNKKE